MNNNNSYPHINQVYINGLIELINACGKYHVGVDSIITFNNGYCVTFIGHNDADAILHDGSRGKTKGHWETMGFPWDKGDISVHSAEELSRLIAELNNSKRDDLESYYFGLGF